jgi:hypothetical protein
MPATGTGNITGFSIENTTPMPMFATYSVVAVLNNAQYPGHTCTGAATQFTITVNPKSNVENPINAGTLMLCENDELYLFVEADVNVHYQWFFNGNLLAGETKYYYETTFDAGKAGIYSVEVYSECHTLIYYFTVNQNSVMIKMKWDDVMYVANADNIYTGYQWYKNGQPISQAGQDQYYSESGGFTPLAEYNVRAFKADGTYDEGCPFIPNDGSKSGSSNLTIYPNPSQSGGTVTIILQLPEGQWSDADGYIYEMTGKLVNQFKITNSSTQITLDVAAGTYAVRIVTAKGKQFVDKIIIQ